MKTKDIDKFKGCLFGGAVGDALGYAVEFQNIEQIREQYGSDGLTEMQLSNGSAWVSDDTQMTLFTANGILVAETEKRLLCDEKSLERHLHNAYLDWHRTQRVGPNRAKGVTSWVYHVPEMHSVRAPGGTCLRSLASGILGTMEFPINSSKGCGGVMRCAPIGLFYDRAHYPIETVDLYGARSAALTHGHQLGFLSAAALVHIVNQCVYGDFSGENALFDIAADCVVAMKNEFGSFDKVTQMTALLEKAIELAKTNLPSTTAIAELGEGWVAEEAVAIALYCALRHKDDFRAALIAAVNHSGDSDSTGSIAGNILGAYLGYDRIPASFLEHLELFEVIKIISEDLYALAGTETNDVCYSEHWQKKYIKADFRIS
ncbi:MAG: ADP-ribosylglycohydrolase family protein [Clostridiaceae bacterium]